MNNLLLLTLACCFPVVAQAQAPSNALLVANRPFTTTGKPAASRTIQGHITGAPLAEDSIFFVRGRIAPKYFDVPISPARISANAFTVKAAVRAPQMRRIVLKSDRGKRIYRRGAVFIDPTTRTLSVDVLAEECTQATGTAATEYRTRFIPYFYPTGAGEACDQRRFDALAWDEASPFDSTLYRYVQTHPTSYVALWTLIERFSAFGHSQLRERTLARFAKGLKASHPWQTLDEDMRRAPIKQGSAFPLFAVKGVSQAEQQLRLPPARYTLVDFWFSRCRPCLESFPAWKQLYRTYQAKGFEIVSISTDKTGEIPLWQQRIKDHALPWTQYLDENARASTPLAVKSLSQ